MSGTESRAGHPVYVSRGGSGARPALLLHCSLASHRAWMPVAERLDDALAWTAPDFPAHGSSGDWDGQGDIHDLSTAIASDLADGPADLIGHSFGATVALRLALERPDLCRSLTLVEPVLFAAAADRAVYARHEAEHAPIMAALAGGDTDLAARLFTDLWGAGAPWDSLSDRQRRGFAERMWIIAETEAALERDAHGLAAPGRLEALDRPTLLVEGRASPEIIASVLDTFQARLPDVRRVGIDGAGHMAPITHAREVAQAIREGLSL